MDCTAHQAPLSMGFLRQEYQSGGREGKKKKERILEWIAISSPGDLPSAEIEPASPVSPPLQEGLH